MYRVAQGVRLVLLSGGVEPWFLRILAVASLVLAILVLNGNLPTGFSGKTLWEWMDVFGVPVVVVLAGGYFVLAAQKANQRAQDERERAADRAGAAILQ